MLRAGLALLLCAFTVQTAPVLRDEIWTQRSATLAHDLTHGPQECLAAETTPEVELGRALFRSPTLLGGPVARIGMSCHSCHVNGRANARFFLPELTDRAGAADVTSEWASAVRGDGVMNPRAIPDLVDVATRTTFGSDGETSLARFTHSVVVEEFQGPAPPPRAFIALVAYLRALRSEHCPAAGLARHTLRDAASDVRRAREAALVAARGGDARSAALAILAAQDGIGRIVERLPAERFARERSALDGLARELTQTRTAPDIARALDNPAWMTRFDVTLRKLTARERQTYFAESTLAAALQGR